MLNDEKRKKEKQTAKRKINHYRTSLEKVATTDYRWIVPLAKKIKPQIPLIAKFMSHVFANIAVAPFSEQKMGGRAGRLVFLKELTRILFPQTDSLLTQVEKSIRTLQEGLGEISTEILTDSDVTQELLTPLLEIACNAIEKNPQIIALFGNPHILEGAFGSIGKRISGLLRIIPAFSSQAAERFPNLKETFFHAFFQLNKEERNKIYLLTEELLNEIYREKVFPILKKTLSVDPRGRILVPILKGAIETIPGESCINALISIACTPKHELSNGRVIAITIQEIGGLYVKVSQVISELCPPGLAKELRITQDDAGGIFPSIEKSWEYFLTVINQEKYIEWKPCLDLPTKPVRHFASASMGALYNITLTQTGKEKFGINSVLIKIQRPKLREIFTIQCEHILKLTDEANKIILDDEKLAPDTRIELLGIVSTLRRATLNYYKQSQEELDFNQEEINSEKVRVALGDNKFICVPRFFKTTEQSVFMECMPGTKVTKIIQTKYLERRKIADTIAQVYIDLVFTKGIVWADPHPGNILYDDLTNKVSIIDINPCYLWDTKTRQEFKHFIYRLFLRDAEGVHRALYSLVENTEPLHSKIIIGALSNFLNTSLGSASLTRFVGELIKTLSENHIDLKVEVQAALRGLSQVALTTSSISARNSFGKILRNQFTLRELVGTVWNVGLLRVARVFLSTLFEFTRQTPEHDIGPVLDERDIKILSQRTQELKLANVCNIIFHRVSPEDHPNLKISQDGQSFLITSDLRIEIIDKIKPATVCYIIEIPLRNWLKERQEFIKLSSVARSFCTIECLEQLRRNSLDDYWHIVEAWSKSNYLRTVEETQLIGEVTIAARKLYSLRFANIWNSFFVGLPMSARVIWRFLLKIELWKERSKQSYLISRKKKFGDMLFANIAYSSFYRIKSLFFEALLWGARYYINNFKFSMHLLPMSTEQLESLIMFGLNRSFRERSRKST